MEVLRSLVCCCSSRDGGRGGKTSPEPQIYIQEEHIIPNEESPLIPPDFDGPSYTDGPFNKKLQERMSTVVRSKEGKMVNLGSQIPFNLHNRRTLLSDRTVSRSASGSLDPPHHHHHFDHNISSSNSDLNLRPKQKPRWMESRSPSPSHPHHRHHGEEEEEDELEQESSRSSRFFMNEPVVEQPRPTAPLGVKLVNYTGPMAGGVNSRGRARERPGYGLTSTSVSPPARKSGEEVEVGEVGKPITSKKRLVELEDASSIVMSWGD